MAPNGWLPFAIYTGTGVREQSCRNWLGSHPCLSNRQALSQEKACQSPQPWLRAAGGPDPEGLKIHRKEECSLRVGNNICFHTPFPLAQGWSTLPAALLSFLVVPSPYLPDLQGARCHLKLLVPIHPTKTQPSICL